MPNPFKNLSEKPEQPKETNYREEVGGVFGCQVCDEVVKGAVITHDGHLAWKCSEGHVSLIRDFDN